LLGKPESVYAETAIFGGSPSAEVAAVTLRYANGASAALTVGCLGTAAFQHFPRIDLVTANGQAHLGGRHHVWESLTWATRADTATHSFTDPPEVLGSTRYTAAMRHFLDCVRTGRPPEAGIEDGLQAVAIAMAITESARSGRRVMLDAMRNEQ
jgi:predicted dehydrogenase